MLRLKAVCAPLGRDVRTKCQPENPRANRRSILVGTGLLITLPKGNASARTAKADFPVQHTDEEWKQLLKPAAYDVLRKASTERPESSILAHEEREGTFLCGGCGTPLFPSGTKFDSGTGWPSFSDPLKGAVQEEVDASLFFMVRTEVHCATCGGHLGHVFDDGPMPTGKRYCMNGAAMTFKPYVPPANPSNESLA